VAGLTNGIYLVRVKQNNGTVQTSKLVVAGK
jgi:hypothetical protein